MRIGTCSWKYKSWQGLVYPEFGEFNYLEEYSKRYNTVEVDRWFWSLHNAKAHLPKPSVVQEYNELTPDNFRFTIKVPNSLTLTNAYKSSTANQYFLSPDLMHAFLYSINPLLKKVGLLMFQFEYLNKQKMNSLTEFIDKFSQFISLIDNPVPIGIEIRNPNYLTKEYFSFLKENNISHVFLQGYYMPKITDVFKKFEDLFTDKSVIRLHGYDRKGIEKEAKKQWNKILRNKDNELSEIIRMIKLLNNKKTDIYINVNNHYEGSAPLTIDKINLELSKTRSE